MARQPFLEDPRDQFARAIAAAVETPIEEVRVVHLRAAEHFAKLTREHRLPFRHPDHR